MSSTTSFSIDLQGDSLGFHGWTPSSSTPDVLNLCPVVTKSPQPVNNVNSGGPQRPTRLSYRSKARVNDVSMDFTSTMLTVKGSRSDGTVGMLPSTPHAMNSSTELSAMVTARSRSTRGHIGKNLTVHSLARTPRMPITQSPSARKSVMQLEMPECEAIPHFRASEGASWDIFSENLARAAMPQGALPRARADSAAGATGGNDDNSPAQRRGGGADDANATRLGGTSTPASQASSSPSGVLAVVLIHRAFCNPFHLGEVDAIKQARDSIEAPGAFAPGPRGRRVVVVGCIVMPHADSVMAEAGIDVARRMPMSIRCKVAQHVIGAADQENWMVVDKCMECCLRAYTGPVAPLVHVYATARLRMSNCETRVVNLHLKECIETDREGSHTVFQVGRPHRFSTVLLDTVIAHTPRKSCLDEQIWAAIKQPQDTNIAYIIELLCGTQALSVIKAFADDVWNKKVRNVMRFGGGD